MEISLMSDSLVDESDVEETVTQVITQFVEDGDEQTAMSVEFLQEKVEFHLGYLAESLNRGRRKRINDDTKTGISASVKCF